MNVKLAVQRVTTGLWTANTQGNACAMRFVRDALPCGVGQTKWKLIVPAHALGESNWITRRWSSRHKNSIVFCSVRKWNGALWAGGGNRNYYLKRRCYGEYWNLNRLDPEGTHSIQWPDCWLDILELDSRQKQAIYPVSKRPDRLGAHSLLLIG